MVLFEFIFDGCVSFVIILCCVYDVELWFVELLVDVELVKLFCGDCFVCIVCFVGVFECCELWGVWGGQLFV